MKKIFTLAVLAVFALAANAEDEETKVTNPEITGTGWVEKCDAGENITRSLSGKWDGTTAINLNTYGTTEKTDKTTGEKKIVTAYANEYEVISVAAKANNVYVIGCDGSKIMVRAISLGGAIQKSFMGIAKDAAVTGAKEEETSGTVKFMSSEVTTGKSDSGYEQTFNGVTYSGENYAQGTTNGMSWAIQPTVDGNLDIAIKMSGDKKFYVIEIDAESYKALTETDLTLAAAYDMAAGSGLCADFQKLVTTTAVAGVAEAKAEVAAPVKVVKNGQVFIGNFNVAGAQVK